MNKIIKKIKIVIFVSSLINESEKQMFSCNHACESYDGTPTVMGILFTYKDNVWNDNTFERIQQLTAYWSPLKVK